MRAASDKLIAPPTASPPSRQRLGALWQRLRRAAIARHGAEVGAWVAFYIAIRALVG